MTSIISVSDQAPILPDGAPRLTATICAGAGEGQEMVLRRAVSLFGGKSGCKLVLRHPTVDRRHCVIVNNGHQIILRDLDTRGRTLLNGLKVEQESLNDADRFSVGPWEFRVDIQDSEFAGAGDSPVIIDLEPDPTILAIEDPNTSKIVKLPREVSVFGRTAGCDFPIEDREVSRVHAIVFNYLNKPALYDLVSENGTFVNGRRVAFAMLQNEDEISFGTYTVKFRSNTPHVNVQANGNGAATLKPSPFGPPPDGTLSDLVDFSADSMLG